MSVENNHIEMAQREIAISRLLKAPVGMVWDAWTQPDEIKIWWGPDGFSNSIQRMEVKPEGSWELIMQGPDGRDYRNVSRFIEIIVEKKLVYDHLTGPKFRATVSLEAKGNNTHLNFSMVFDTPEIKMRAEREFGAAEGQKQSIGRLEDYLQKKILGNPVIRVSQVFKASRERVWKALTEREEMKKWYFNIPEFMPVPGSEFSFEGGNEDRIYIHQCKILEVIPGRKLSHTWSYQGYPGVTRVNFELVEEGENTRLSLQHFGLETLPQDNPDFDRKNFAQGWDFIIHQSLVNYLAETE